MRILLLFANILLVVLGILVLLVMYRIGHYRLGQFGVILLVFTLSAILTEVFFFRSTRRGTLTSPRAED